MWGISDFALASIQAISVPIYPTIPSDQVSYIADNIGITYAIVENMEQYNKLQEAGVTLDQIIMMYPEDKESEAYHTFEEIEEIGRVNENPGWEEMWIDLDRDQLLTRSEERRVGKECR